MCVGLPSPIAILKCSLEQGSPRAVRARVLVRQREMAAKLAEELARSVTINRRQRKEEMARAGKAADAARAHRARTIFEKRMKK